ncbi:MAG TPA: peptidoglycan-binding domain-containing protein, partial [Candidatus Limiplasma sp.]|nr:peptidoglycan-binding domain-containing protein [Candidatus Limiplasma sp.]
GWTHVILFKEIDYDVDIPAGVTVSTLLTDDDTTKENPEGIADTTDVSKFFTVKRGCKGGAVRRLQTWLNDVQGGNLLAEDGDFGPTTDAAVRVFQQANGLDVDGVVGPKTWAALAEARQGAST